MREIEHNLVLMDLKYRRRKLGKWASKSIKKLFWRRLLLNGNMGFCAIVYSYGELIYKCLIDVPIRGSHKS